MSENSDAKSNETASCKDHTTSKPSDQVIDEIVNDVLAARFNRKQYTVLAHAIKMCIENNVKSSEIPASFATLRNR